MIVRRLGHLNHGRDKAWLAIGTWARIELPTISVASGTHAEGKLIMDTPKSHQIPPDSPAYIDAWARDVVNAAGKKAARQLLTDYRSLARSKRGTKADREVAAERARAMSKLL